jgi:hypothetical protein
MTLSDSLSRVDWKLNQLLAADRRAREYARQSGQSGSQPDRRFAPWAPRELEAGQTGLVEPEAGQELSGDTAAEPNNDPEKLSNESTVAVEEPDPEPDIDALLAEARAAGERSGYARAMTELEGEQQQQREQLQQLVTAVGEARIDLTDYVSFVRELATVLAEKVTREELSCSVDRMQVLVQSALQRLEVATDSEVQIFANGRTLQILREALDGIQTRPVLRTDEQLGDGDFHFKMAATEGYELIAEKIRDVVTDLFGADQLSSEQLPEPRSSSNVTQETAATGGQDSLTDSGESGHEDRQARSPAEQHSESGIHAEPSVPPNLEEPSDNQEAD